MQELLVSNLTDEYWNKWHKILKDKYGENEIQDGFNYIRYNTNSKLKRMVTNFNGKLIFKINKLLQWEEITGYHNLTIDFLLNNINLNNWNWSNISAHPNLTLKQIINNITLPWDWKTISLNLNVKVKDVVNNLDKPWDYDILFDNITFITDFIISQPTYTQVLLLLVKSHRKIKINKNAKQSLLDSYCEKTFKDSYKLIMSVNTSSNYSILILKFVLENLDKSWDWFGINFHEDDYYNSYFVDPNQMWVSYYERISKNASMEIILNNPNIEWNMNSICDNPNLTLDFVFENAKNMFNYKKCNVSNDVINYICHGLKFIIVAKILTKKTDRKFVGILNCNNIVKKIIKY